MSEDACQKEVERLHRFFMDWFTGRVCGGNEYEILESECASRFSTDFWLINPLGFVIPKPQLVQGLENAYNSHPADFEIHIHNFRLLQDLTDEFKLVIYEEWQRSGIQTTARRSTAILQYRVHEDSFLWRNVHETWLEGKGPPPMVNSNNPDTSHQLVERKSGSLVSARRHVSDKLASFGASPIISQENVVVGLEFRSLKLQTTQGPMADHSWLEATTAHLEQLAQPAGLRRRRRLTLPEVCFAHAAVAIQLPTGTLLSWTVQEALEEWSRAHQHIGMGSYEHRSRGVQVLKSADADLWKSKITTATACDFHYDWTFCTPFCGHVSAGQWIPMAASGIQVELLKDTTQPILYFDEIELYQDDLHDNGVVNFRIKLRVMPTCIYVLARCWLRVDGVVLTSRETRIFVDFGSQDNSLRVYRDITWRQAWWKDLARKGLPTDVRAWKNEGPTETAAWQALVNRLPLDELPNDLVAHSILQLKNDKMETTKRI